MTPLTPIELIPAALAPLLAAGAALYALKTWRDRG